MQKSSIFIDNAWKCKCNCYRIPFGSCSRHATSSNSINIVAFVICFHRFVTVVFLYHSFGWIAPVFRMNVIPTKPRFNAQRLFCIVTYQYERNINPMTVCHLKIGLVAASNLHTIISMFSDFLRIWLNTIFFCSFATRFYRFGQKVF